MPEYGMVIFNLSTLFDIKAEASHLKPQLAGALPRLILLHTLCSIPLYAKGL